MLIRKEWIVFAVLQTVIAVVLSEKYKVITVDEPVYEPTWESLDSRPLPKWFDEAKVGIFIHWGVYSVPSMGSEWFFKYWREDRNPEYVDYMTNNFRPGFTYQEFAPQFTAEHYNATEWAKLFEDSGAKYVVLTSKHHDGYALWPSKYSYSWNSVDVGPHRDLVGELADAVRQNTSMRFGLYHSLFEWFHPLCLSDKKSNFKEKQFVYYKVKPQLLELIDAYKPEIIWSDGDGIAESDYWESKEFLAWLYNESPIRKTVVTNDRWGLDAECKHGGFLNCEDRHNPGVLQKRKWENAMTIDKQSWGQRDNARLEDFMTTAELIKELAITISTGGNILINVGPTHSGLIQPIFVERLREMGTWLRLNGEAIYASRPWLFQNDTESKDIWYTSKQTENNRTLVYAIVLEYPYDSAGVNLYKLGGKYDDNTKVRMLGYSGELKWYGSGESVYVEFPDKAAIDKLGLHSAWTLEFNIPSK